MNNITKSKTRLAAIQVIFQSLINKKNIKEVKNEFDKYYRNTSLEINGKKIIYNKNFLSLLIEYYILTEQNFNFVNEINKFIKFKRTFEKWDYINKALMIMAISELKNSDYKKHNLIINDYIEISKSFMTIKDTKIINAVLDNFLKTQTNE